MKWLATLLLLGCGNAAEQAPPAHPADADAATPAKPVTLASSQPRLVALAVDAANVYFTSDKLLRALPKSGAGAFDLAPIASPFQEPLAVSAGNVYFWADATHLVQVSGGGGDAQPLALAERASGGVAVVDGRAYWAELDEAAPPRVTALASVSLSSPGLATLRRDAVPADASIMISAGPLIAAGGDAIFVGGVLANGLYRFPIDGSPVSAIAFNHRATSLVVDDATVYISSSESIWSMPKTGGEPRVLVDRVLRPAGIAVDGSHLYFVEETPKGRVLKVPKAGGDPIALASEQGAPHAIAVDETNVYWTCRDDGTIKRIAK